MEGGRREGRREAGREGKEGREGEREGGLVKEGEEGEEREGRREVGGRGRGDREGRGKERKKLLLHTCTHTLALTQLSLKGRLELTGL